MGQTLNNNSRRSGNKSAGAFRTISEVASELNVPQHVLRFWETRFTQIKPMKRGGGRRYYRPEDIALLTRVRSLLYEDGYTIKGVQKLFRDGGLKKQLSQRKPYSKDVIVKTMSVDTKPTAEITGIDPGKRVELQGVLRELVSLRKLLGEV
ncbi:MAG: transcriptional regulator [Rhodospirillaceae bacterium]|nr:transcriptional regulator [Rhodospirillaceae bacterium]